MQTDMKVLRYLLDERTYQITFNSVQVGRDYSFSSSSPMKRRASERAQLPAQVHTLSFTSEYLWRKPIVPESELYEARTYCPPA